jgi:hypothetical protein
LFGWHWPSAALAEDAKKGIGVEEAIASLPNALKTPNRFAVVIGASQYADERIPKLPACVNDAKALYETLTDPAIGMFSKENVTLLTDQQVTKENVIDALDQLGRRAGQQDLVVVFFSGHGATDERGRAYWVMNNTQIDKLRATALAETDITELLGEVKTTRLVALIDACYSAATANLQQTKSLLDLAAIFPRFQGEGRVAITASKGDQLSVVIKDKSDPGYGFSAFTWQVIQGLRGQADIDKDGVVTVDELWNYVKDRTEQTARQQGGEQYPQLKGQLGSRFLLALNLEQLRRRLLETAQVRQLRTDRLAKLKQLYLDQKLNRDLYQMGERLLQAVESELDEFDKRRLAEFISVLEDRLDADKLPRALDAIETPEQQADRLAHEAQELAEREKIQKIAHLLAKAKANDSEANAKVAIAALDQVLEIDPEHREAQQLRNKIIRYYSWSGKDSGRGQRVNVDGDSMLVYFLNKRDIMVCTRGFIAKILFGQPAGNGGQGSFSHNDHQFRITWNVSSTGYAEISITRE